MADNYPDPFAAATPEPEPAPPAPATPAPETPKPAPDHRPRLVGNGPDEAGEVVVTFKGGQGYDAPWVVVHAPDAASALAKLDQSMADLMSRVGQISLFFQTKVGEFTGGAKPRGDGAKPQDVAKNAPSGEVKYCDHGTRVYNSGCKDGKPWGGWFCSLPKNASGKCSPIWDR